MNLQGYLGKIVVYAEDFDQKEYLKWKRKNVSYRGMGNVGEANGGAALMGPGLYSAALSNKKMAKTYGDLYFAVNAPPKNPKVLKSLWEWDMFEQSIVSDFCKKNEHEYDARYFRAHNKIEEAIQKLGFDGVIIIGREMVNYKPKNVYYFKTEDEVKNYYEILEQ